MPDKYGFNLFGMPSTQEVECIEINCGAGGKIWDWPEKEREKHFLEHNKEKDIIIYSQNILNNNSFSLDRTVITICRTCSNEFKQERKRGRPRVFCYACKPGG